jgi:aryl carrier-like protein
MPSQTPNFLFIGPDKAGSTWLYEALKQHRQVFLPSVKEIFFFDQFYDKGWHWYSRYFKNAQEQHRIVAETCHDYLFSPLACQRIAHDLPTAKLMVCLREPVQRAFSAYLYLLKVGEVAVDFEAALDDEDELIDRGLYARHLRFYLEHFRRDQIYVAVFDDLAADPQQFFDRLCDFLGIECLALPAELKQKILPAAKSRLPRVTKFARDMSWTLRRWGFPGLVGAIKESPLLSRVLYRAFAPDEKPVMSPAAREHLRGIFAPEIERLDALLGTDLLSRWGYSESRQRDARSVASASGG